MPTNGGFRSGLPTMPSVQNGMLKFTDQAHFDEYLAYLDALVMDEPQTEAQTDNDSTEFDAKLLQVETNLNFSSLRAELVADFEALNQQGFATLEQIPAEHFVPSSSLRSVLNENLAAKIGNSIFIYYNEDWLIEITDGNIETRDEIGSLRKESPNSLPVAIYSLANIKLHPLNSAIPAQPTVRAKCFFPDYSIGGGMLDVLECSGLTREYLAFGLSESVANPCVYDNYPNCISWRFQFSTGDVIDTTSCPNSNLGNSNEVTISYTYPAPGNYTVIRIMRDASTNTVLMRDTIQTHFVGNSCSKTNRTSTTNWHTSNTGTHAFSTQIRKYAGFGFLTGSRYYNTHTKSYRWNGSVWRAERVERLAAQLWASGREDDCNGLSPQSVGASWPHNSRNAETTVRVSKKYSSNGDAYSNHRMWHNNVQYNQNRVLNVCP